MYYPETKQELDEALETLFTDEDGHVIHEKLWGGIDPTGHNKNPDGSPSGDCYKCRVIRDAVHDAIRKFAHFDEGD